MSAAPALKVCGFWFVNIRRAYEMHHAHIDKFAYQDSPVHRLDSRVKFIAVLIFTAVVISLPRTSVSILACYAIGPFTILVWAKIPLRFVFKQILLVSPFVLILALSCPLYDRTPYTIAFGPFLWASTTGWMRCFTILGKFIVRNPTCKLHTLGNAQRSCLFFQFCLLRTSSDNQELCFWNLFQDQGYRINQSLCIIYWF